MPTTLLLDKEEMTRILERLACEVLERHGQCERVMLVGIERRGADLARRLGALMQQKLQRPLPLGTLDINLYRDDWTSLEGKPHIGQSRITAPVDNAEIILIDDVLFSGRTIRAALEALLDYGRPRKVELLVLVDRGHRELPIQPDYLGRAVPTSSQEIVDVRVKELDGEDTEFLARKLLVRGEMLFIEPLFKRQHEAVRAVEPVGHDGAQRAAALLLGIIFRNGDLVER